MIARLMVGGSPGAHDELVLPADKRDLAVEERVGAGDLHVPDRHVHRLGVGDIPTLAEVLDATTTPLQIEIKAAGAVPPLMDLLRSSPEQRDRIMVTTFQDDLLRQVAEERLGVELGIIRSRHDPDRLGIFVDCPGLTHYFPGWEGVTGQVVTGIHERRLRTGVWPVRTLAEFDRAIELGVDAVTVDDPEPFIAHLRQK